MNLLDDLLEERLARLEAGEPLEACLSGLPEDEAVLLKKAARLRAISEAGPAPDRIAAGRRELLRLAQENKKMASQSSTTGDKARSLTQPRWSGRLPAALAAGALALFTCVTLFSMLVGVSWFSQQRSVAQNPTSVSPGATPTGGLNQGVPTPVPTTVALEAPDPQTAVLKEAHGLVEVQDSRGAWAAAEAGAIVKAGQRLRTGALSSVTLAFYDGSQARLGPNAEVSVDQLDAQKSGARVVVLTQWIGESDHAVAASSDPASHYDVNTPSGSGTAKGTAFHVLVTSTLLVRFDVDEGAVAVTSLNVTVIVVAGQSTVIIAGQPPQEPVFRISGEGKVEQITNDRWRIAGRTFRTHENTVIIGHPQVGDWVAFKGRVLLDGTHVADRIVLLERAPENRFAFVGTVEAIGQTEWTIAGRTVRVDESTEIDSNIQIGNLVEVRGGIAQDGTLWATRIRLLEDESGLPFEFVGVVQGITETVWTISGISVTVDSNTQIESGIVVGEIVRVRGRILADGTWLAKSIQRAEETQREFVIVGRVQSRDPWVVDGIAFETNARTEIDDGIQVGDRVRVEGRIREDGRWVAREIQLLDDNDDEEKPRRFAFTGVVSSINPWIVGGVPLTVDANTIIEGEVTVGALVRVRGVILPDGTWLAQKIKRLDRNLGCLNLSTAVRQVDADQVVLLDWQTVKLGEGVSVQGEVKVATVIVVFGCVQEDGTLIVVNVVVISQLDRLPIIIISPPPGDDGASGGGKIVICHRHQGESGGTETITVDWSAWINAHSRHGDTLGPCPPPGGGDGGGGGGGGGDDDDD